jgi:hypothetical protein
MGADSPVACLELSFAERRTVMMQLFDRHTYAEIAARDGVSIKAVWMRKYRARVRARRHGVEIPKRPPAPHRAHSVQLSLLGQM